MDFPFTKISLFFHPTTRKKKTVCIFNIHRKKNSAHMKCNRASYTYAIYMNIYKRCQDDRGLFERLRIKQQRGKQNPQPTKNKIEYLPIYLWIFFHIQNSLYRNVCFFLLCEHPVALHTQAFYIKLYFRYAYLLQSVLRHVFVWFNDLLNSTFRLLPWRIDRGRITCNPHMQICV